MTRILTQIYEVQTPEEAAALAALGVDNIGTVILSREDWQSPILRDTIRISRQAGVQSGLMPLFDDEMTILRLLDYYRPDFVHFCEALSPFPADANVTGRACDALLTLQGAVKKAFPDLAVMRSLSVPQQDRTGDPGIRAQILNQVRMLAPLSDYFLIDTFRGSHHDRQDQPVAGFVGITGEPCDWQIAAGIVAASPVPVILAGGISAENVFEAIITVRPAGVDSCTRTNAVDADGKPIRFKKDLRKVARMIAEVRRAEARLFGL